MIWFVILLLLFRLRGCLQWMLAFFLVVWVCHRHPGVARDLWELIDVLDRKITQLIDEKNNTNSLDSSNGPVLPRNAPGH